MSAREELATLVIKALNVDGIDQEDGNISLDMKEAGLSNDEMKALGDDGDQKLKSSELAKVMNENAETLLKKLDRKEEINTTDFENCFDEVQVKMAAKSLFKKLLECDDNNDGAISMEELKACAKANTQQQDKEPQEGGARRRRSRRARGKRSSRRRRRASGRRSARRSKRVRRRRTRRRY